MFDFLNKPTHHHSANKPQVKQQHHRSQLQSSQQSFNNKSQNINNKYNFNNINSNNIHNDNQIQFSSNKSSYKSNNIKSEFSRNGKYRKYLNQKQQKKSSSIVRQQIRLSFMMLNKQMVQLFKSMLNQSSQLHYNGFVSEVISKQQKAIQKRVYARQTATNLSLYLNQLFEKVPIYNQVLKNDLNTLTENTIANIVTDIQAENSSYQIFHKKNITKDDLAELDKLNQIRMIKIKEGQISSKIGQLKIQFNLSNVQIQSKLNTINNNSINNHKITKRVDIKKKIQMMNKKKQLQLQQKAKQQQHQQKLKLQKHNQLKQKLQNKKLIKQKQLQSIKQQKKKFNQFLKQYKNAKPLFQSKLQQQIRQQIQQKRQRYEKMKQRKNNYNPLNFGHLQQFQQKYLLLKKQHDQQKKLQIQLKKDEQKYRIAQMKQKNYKGKYRYLILQQMVNKQSQEQQSQFMKNLLIEKRKSYSIDVKQRYKPKIDIQKQLVRYDSLDLQNISYDNNEQEQSDYKKQGIRNFKLFKQYISQKIAKEQIKRPQTYQINKNSYIPKIDYLRQQREDRETKGSSFSYQSLDADKRLKRIKMISNGDINTIKIKTSELDQKARRQQLKIKYSQHTPDDQKQLQEDYLTSIKAKIQILNHYK